ncbi:hypothetical protein [Veillonella sp.]|jgi:hypothetical protein|uniref:hypothetical protein n=1 Tax=Veillonella sp. TaxID=1926307 RepID=UPI00204DEDB4|nr:hypothetical protein [Veillonella sp.]MBS6486395.1 hypothetical protein [Veillonella sp.]DAL52957.1 MAG TPA_asm: hypothetical protein [Caudoviricetes sp.]
MANTRFPKAGDTVRIINCKRAEQYQGKEFIVKRAPFVCDRQKVAVIDGLRGYIPIKNLEIIKNA